MTRRESEGESQIPMLPDAPEVASIPENQENVEPSVDFRTEPCVSPVIQTPLHRANSLSSRHLAGYSLQQFLDERCRDFQKLQNENQALREENQALRDAQAASDDRGSLQEQVKQVGTILKTFARNGQSGAGQTLMLRRLGEFGDVVRDMDNKMDTMLQDFSANVSVGELSLPGDLLLPLDTQEDLALLDNRDKACFRDLFLKTIVQRAIRKNLATQDATDEAVQENVMRYLKGASDREG
ncbi:hypothetical protein E1301_Tti013632 [Triplophysa tibetana]|uniref:Uncharacterized protein n=1 Tax=Triplophysa tibetana TaxID=1572043 RepID=A0A5A9NSK5_9TELE|nr:hypothetical protein E1301_Tti013632 [Triplophysa tibetana]